MAPSTTLSEPLRQQLYWILRHAIDLLRDVRPAAEVSADINRSTSALLTACEPAGKPASLPWNDRISAVQGLDRSLALLSILDAELAHRTGAVVFDSISHSATQTLAAMLATMKSMASSSQMLFGSGAIVDVASGVTAGVPAYTFGTEHEQGRQRLLAGVASDALELVDELSRASSSRSFPTSADRKLLRDDWDVYLAPFAHKVTVPADWVPGGWAVGADFAAGIPSGAGSLSLSELARMRRRYEVIAVRWWDGSYRYPVRQLDPSTGKPYAHIVKVLSAVQKRISPIALAIWLGKQPLGTHDRFAELETDAGADRVLAELQQLEALKKPVVQIPTPNVPPEAEIAAAPSRGIGTSIPGWAASLQRRWAAAPSARKPTVPGVLFRVSHRANGPFWFARPKGPMSGGRFDLTRKNGTCYLSREPVGAFGEVFGRLLVLDIQEAAGRLLWTMRNLDDISPILDISDGSDASRQLHLHKDLQTSRHRDATQTFAKWVHRAGYTAIEHPLSYSGTQGIALFGKAGTGVPEDLGVGSWHARHQPVAEHKEFWSWLNGLSAPIVMMNQLPLSQIA